MCCTCFFFYSSPFPFPFDFMGKEALITKGNTYNNYFKLKGTDTALRVLTDMIRRDL